MKAIILVFCILALTSVFFFRNNKPGQTQEEIIKKPAIVEHFACGDNCPGSREQYIKMIYEGVSDEAECRSHGGEPYTYYGWLSTTICLAE